MKMVLTKNWGFFQFIEVVLNICCPSLPLRVDQGSGHYFIASIGFNLKNNAVFL